MKKHPIFNSDCSHYDNESQPVILQMQTMMSYKELKAYCIGNVYKYQGRIGKKKGESIEENLKKQESYRYGALLYTLLKKLEKNHIEWHLLIKIYRANITEEDIKTYLEMPEYYAGDKEIYIDSFKELLEYLLRS